VIEEFSGKALRRCRSQSVRGTFNELFFGEFVMQLPHGNRSKSLDTVLWAIAVVLFVAIIYVARL
jgi:hypothetical protein